MRTLLCVLRACGVYISKLISNTSYCTANCCIGFFLCVCGMQAFSTELANLKEDLLEKPIVRSVAQVEVR